MGAFARELARRQPASEAGRRWVFVAYDQLSDGIGPLAREAPESLGIVLVESPWKAARRPYHRAKLALVLANLRHFALEQAARGVAVRHVVVDGPYRDALAPLAAELGLLRAMEPAERELRGDLAPLVAAGALELLPHEGWLTTEAQFRASHRRPPYRMDRFYRHVRDETGILMHPGGGPVGGRYSLDDENRRRWDGDPPAPEPPVFPVDPIKEEVAALVARRFARHPGRVRLDDLPATKADAEAQWAWAKRACLRDFGPYEDAMSTRSSNLFHTRISALLNLHRLLPRRVLDDVLAMEDLPLNSREGFVRQLLGWREFVRHVHRETDGFRDVPGVPVRVLPAPGDGGFAAYRRARGEAADSPSPAPPAAADDGGDGGAELDALGGDGALPPAFWGEPSGLRCLDTVVRDVWAEASSHHITRLMVLGNLARLLDVSPRALTDWFWVAYRDAYDWVVEPNVLGMATYASAGLMITKPYVSGAAYLDRMSDYCRGCAFHPKRDCPVTPLYWAFLARHRDALDGNPRMLVQLKAVDARDPVKRRHDARVFHAVRTVLAEGRPLTPADLPPP